MNWYNFDISFIGILQFFNDLEKNKLKYQIFLRNNIYFGYIAIYIFKEYVVLREYIFFYLLF